MKEFIAVGNSDRDFEFIKKYYSDTAGIRVQLKNIIDRDFLSLIPENISVWIDPGVDALSRIEDNNLADKWKDFFKGFENGEDLIKNIKRGSITEKGKVINFAKSVLDTCNEYDPKWISTPQVPFRIDSETNRNKLNRDLAKGTGEWLRKENNHSKLMLPMIFDNQDILNMQGNRSEVIRILNQLLDRLQPNGIWVVNSGLNDEEAWSKHNQQRLPGLISFHSRLKQEFENTDLTFVAGPYWAMNLILWARQLIDLPLISIGTGYQYYRSGGEYLRRPADRICIPILRRRVRHSPELKNWLKNSIAKLNKSDLSDSEVTGIGDRLDKAAKELSELKNNFDILEGDIGHEQVARCYKEWYDNIHQVNPSMRALYMRQNFSTADVIGRILNPLPEKNKTQDPSKLARQYMLNCF